ncbi:MAG: peptide ABC transporter substrate-binding protein [Planctomycetaceae bacterium]|nr:peptide ABC transporter substrate-binding protein [Planctomycetaceae bacterium]
MRHTGRFQQWTLALAFCLLILSGCPKAPQESEGPSGSEATGATNASADSTPDVILEPYDPPTLEELNASVEWEDMPVADTYQLYKEHLAQSQPLVTVEEALRLRNDSPEANEKIISALGRPPVSDGDVGWDRTMTRAISRDIKSTNPLMISASEEFELAGLTGFNLFTFDWNFTPYATADYVKSWQSSKDRLYDKVILRDDMVWSDGTPITAHDIVFSFQTILNPKIPIPAVRAGTDDIRWIEAYDDRTLVYFHKEALATNVWNVNFPVIPKHIYEKSLADDFTLTQSEYHLKYERNPVCGGPYKLIRRIDKQELVVERRDDWYMKNGKEVRSKPFFKSIRLRVLQDPNTALLALKKGEIDDRELTADQWVTQTVDADFYRHNTKAYGLQWLFAYAGWNIRTPYFGDKKVRWAMSYAFDHEEMLKNICYGLYEPCLGIFYKASWMAPRPMPKPIQQNLDKAEALLDEAGWKDTDGDGYRDKVVDGRKTKFEFTMIVPSESPISLKIGALFKDNLDQIGVLCHVKPTESTVIQQKTLDHDFHAFLGAWGTGADPATSDNIWKTDAGRNFVQYSNPEVDQLFKAGEREFDRDKRAEIYGKIATLIWDDQPYTFLYNRSGFYGFNRDIRGYMFSPRGPYTYGPGFDAIWKVAN